MKRLLLAILTLTLLTGCGAKFVYNNLDMISPWYVDDFISLDRAQKKRYQAHLRDIHHWHRQHELPEYHRLLVELHEHLDNSELDADFLIDHLGALRQRWQILIQQATPALTDMALTLSDEQVDEIANAMADANQDRLKEADSPAEHSKDAHKGISRWLGKLSNDQTAMVETFAQQHPDRTDITVAAHRAFQAKLTASLLNRSHENFTSDFAALIAEPLATPEGLQLTQVRMAAMQDRITLYQALWQRASDTQKDKVRRRLTDMIEDIEALMVKAG